MPTHIQIGDVSPRIQYVGDGAQTQFTYPFPIFQDADMEAYVDNTLKTLTTDYTVAGAGSSSGGSVTFAAAPANGATVTLRRRLDIQRTSDFQESGEFRAKVINNELDVLTASVQQVNDDAGRSLHLGPTDAATSLEIPDKAVRADKYLAFDANGDPAAGDPTGPQGPQGDQGVPGADGTDPGMLFVWEDTVVATGADTDQGAGAVFTDNATLTSVTAFYIDDVDANGGDVTAWVARMDDSTTSSDRGSIRIQENADTANWAEFKVNSANTAKTGYTYVSVAYVAHNGSFTDGNSVSVQFQRSGNTGAGAGDMIGANNLSELTNKGAARTNLELGSAATKNTGTGVSDVPTITDADGRYLQSETSHADVLVDGDFSAAEGFLRKTGAGAYEAIKSNLNASVDPVVGDDSNDGYAIGSRWINTTLDKEFVCLNAGVGAAQWTETTGGGGGGADVQVITSTASNAWTKPSSGTWVRIDAWGGGGSGGVDQPTVGGGGGGGGAFNSIVMKLSDIAGDQDVTIGAGGASVTTNLTDGNAGGNTIFGPSGTPILTGYGGTAGKKGGGGGGGGGALSVGVVTATSANGDTGGGPNGGAGSSSVGVAGGDAGFGGGGGGSKQGNGGAAVWGGGGGGGSDSNVGNSTGADGGNSVRGGAGGGAGGGSAGGAGGTSEGGGNGGNGATSPTNATAGASPGGGGGGAEDTGDSGAGGNGLVVVTVW